MGSNASMEVLRPKDDGEKTTETYHVHAHGATWVEAVYTNESATIDRILDKYEGWLKENDLKFVGLDLEYDAKQEKVAVMQIAMRKHVLVFHMIRCNENFPRLRSFLQQQDIVFVGVDTRGDSRVLLNDWIDIPAQNHIDIQLIYKIPGKGFRAGMAALAGKLIDPKYLRMKDDFKHDFRKRKGHDYWEWKPLSEKNLNYAILDGYVTSLLQKGL